MPLGFRATFCLAAYLFGALSRPGWAALPPPSGGEGTPGSISRNVFIDAGFGVPNLFFLQGQAMLERKWQIGFGYGTVPGLSVIASGIRLPQQTVTLQGGVDVTTDPVMDANYNTLVPFVRWYPRGDNFYVQFSFTLLRATATVTGDLVDPLTSSTVGNITGDVTILQPLPMLGVGHIWVGKRYFFNIMIGMSFFLLGANTSVEFASFIPSALGGTAGNQQAINDLQNGISAAVDDATASLKTRYPVIPSLALSFGVML